MSGSSHNYYFKKLNEVDFEVLAEIIKIDATSFPQAWTEKQWKDSLSNENYHLGLTLLNNVPIAFSLYNLAKEDAFSHLYKFLVVPEYRGKKIAQDHINRDFDSLKRNSIGEIYLEVEMTNNAAIKLYLKNGFKKLVTKKHFYGRDQHADAMSLVL